MLKKKEGNVLEISKKEKSKVYGGTCGQACVYSCPCEPIHKKFTDFQEDYEAWKVSPFPPTV
jgi:hypothetical protein